MKHSLRRPKSLGLGMCPTVVPFRFLCARASPHCSVAPTVDGTSPTSGMPRPALDEADVFTALCVSKLLPRLSWQLLFSFVLSSRFLLGERSNKGSHARPSTPVCHGKSCKRAPENHGKMCRSKASNKGPSVVGACTPRMQSGML